MISIFNGRSRSLGGETTKTFVKVSVNFRRHLRHFKGAKLAVFFDIAMHIDADGWAEPDISMIRRESGYNKDTICAALKGLCETKINGHRVLLRDNARGQKGRFGGNRYLIFPSEDEVLKYEGPDEQGLHAVSEKPETVKPSPARPETVKPETVQPDTAQPDVAAPDTANPTVIIEEPVRQEPLLEEPSKEKHPHQNAPPSAVQPPPTAGVGVGFSKFSFEERAAHATEHGLGAGWIQVSRDGRFDEVIEHVRNQSAPEQIEQARSAVPDGRKTYGEALDHVHSILSFGAGHDPAAIIAQMDVADDVRARLVKKLVDTKPEEGSA